MKKSDEFLKSVKSGKRLLISGLVLLVLSIAVGIIVSYLILNEEKVPFADVADVDVYTSVDVELITDYFATETTDGVLEKFYIVYDKNYLYIAKIDNKTFNELSEIYEYSYSEDENAIAPDSVTIIGRSKSIPKEVFNYAKDFLVGNDEMSDEEFRNYVGYYYIDTYDTTNDYIVFIVIICGVMSLVGIILLIIYFIRHIKTKKNLEKYKEELEKICSEVDAGDAIHSKICKAYLTNRYLINYASGLKIIDLKDVVWIYPYEYRQNGVVTQKSIYVINKKGKTNVVASTSAWGKKNKIAYEEFYQELMNKIPDALHGYSKENKDKAKEMFKK